MPDRSRVVSKGIWRIAGLMTWGVATKHRVCPSAGALATKSVPTTVPAPGLYSTSTVWPQAVCRCCCSERARMSIAPPGALGTISVTGLLGKVCALAGSVDKPTAAPKAATAVWWNWRRV